MLTRPCRQAILPHPWLSKGRPAAIAASMKLPSRHPAQVLSSQTCGMAPASKNALPCPLRSDRPSWFGWLIMVMTCGDDRGAGALLSPLARARLLEQLFRSESRGLARYLRSRIGRDDDVQDLVQETFARLAAAKPCALTDRPQAYLQRIARNLLVDRFRRGERQLASFHVPVEEALALSSAPQQEWALEARDCQAW